MTDEAPVTDALEVSESLLDGASVIDTSKGKPADFPDSFWNSETNTANVDVMFKEFQNRDKIAKDLRVKLSKGEFIGTAPEDVKEYVLELSEELKPMIPDGDPLFEAARLAAKEAGMPKEAFSKFMLPMVQKIAELQAEAMKPPSQEEIDSFKAQELAKFGTNGAKVAGAVKSFIDELGAKGMFTPEDVKTAQGMITTADQLKVFNRLRSMMSTSDVPITVDTGMAATRSDLENKLGQAAASKNEAEYNRISSELRRLA